MTDFDAWRAAFDAYAAVRSQMGVRQWRIARAADDPLRVSIELDFDSAGEAKGFADFLVEKVWRTPRSQAVLAGHHVPILLERVESG